MNFRGGNGDELDNEMFGAVQDEDDHQIGQNWPGPTGPNVNNAFMTTEQFINDDTDNLGLAGNTQIHQENLYNANQQNVQQNNTEDYLLDANMFAFELKKNLKIGIGSMNHAQRDMASTKLQRMSQSDLFLPTMFGILKNSDDSKLYDPAVVFLEKTIKYEFKVNIPTTANIFNLIKEVIIVLENDQIPLRLMKILSKIFFSLLSNNKVWSPVVSELLSDIKAYLNSNDLNKMKAICFLYRQLVLSVSGINEILDFFYNTFEDLMNLYDKLIAKAINEMIPHEKFLYDLKNGLAVKQKKLVNNIARLEYDVPDNLRKVLETLLVFQKAMLQYFKKGQIRQNGGVIQFLAQNQRFLNLLCMFDSISGQIPEFIIEWDGLGPLFEREKIKNLGG